MKHLLLSIILLLPCLRAETGKAAASSALFLPASTSYNESPISLMSGSNTVFLPVSMDDYEFFPAAKDKFFNKSKLYDILESNQNHELWVVRVDPFVFSTAYYYTYQGYAVSLGFAGRDTITFNYYSQVSAIVGQNAEGNVVVVLPETPLP